MVKESLQVPRKCHSIIIGKSYSNLKELTEKTGVKVLVPSFDSLSEILILRVCYLLFVVCCLLFVVCCLLFVVCCCYWSLWCCCFRLFYF